MAKKYLIIIFVALAILIFNPYPFLGGDNVVYSILSKSLITGNGYAEIHKPDSTPHTQYPPGFSILLSPLVALFGLNLTILKFIPLLISIIGVILYSKINWGDNEIDVLSLSLLAFSPLILNYSSIVLSELPFFGAIIGSIYCHQKKKDIIAWLLAAFALYIRTAGLFLIGAYLLYYIINKDFKKFLYSFVIFVSLYLPWFIRNKIVGGGTSYITQFLSVDPYHPELGRLTVIYFFERVLNNLQLYILNIMPESFSTLLGQLKLYLGIFILALIIIGILYPPKELKFIRYVVILFFVTILLWPLVWSSDRFFLPGFPLTLPFLVVGARKLIKEKSRYLIIALVVLSAISIIIKIPESIKQKSFFLSGNYEYGLTPDWRNFRQICLLAKNNLEPGIIVSRKPEFTYMWSNHKSDIYPFSYDHETVWNGVKSYDYIIVDSFYWSASTQKYLVPALLKHRTDVTALYKTGKPETWLLKIKIQTSQ